MDNTHSLFLNSTKGEVIIRLLCFMTGFVLAVMVITSPRIILKHRSPHIHFRNLLQNIVVPSALKDRPQECALGKNLEEV
jgi:hypothetical protein